MGTIIDKLKYLKTTKSNIKDSINEKGVEVTDTTTFREYAEKISEITAGGEEEEKFQILVIDYTGDIIDEKWLKNGETYILPEPPTHDRLVFAEWACTQEIVDNKVTVNEKDIHIGPIYDTKSGATEIDITIDGRVVNQSITFHVGSNYSQSTIDWGDGSAVQSITAQNTTHTYTTAGKYTILVKNNGTSNLQFYGSALLSNYRDIVTNIFFADNVFLGTYVCQNFRNLRTVTLPKSCTQTTSYTFENCTNLIAAIKSKAFSSGQIDPISSGFRYCYNLKYLIVGYDKNNTWTNWSSGLGGLYNLVSFVIPEGCLTLNYEFFRGCYSLKRCFLPTTLNNWSSTRYGETFRLCHSLEKINIDKCTGLTFLPGSVFYSCYSLSKLTLPPNINTLNSYSFYSTDIRKLDLGNITTIGTSEFYNSNIESIILPSTIETLATANNLLSTCYCLKEVTVNCNSTALPNSFCENDSALRTVRLNGIISAINNRCFYNCAALETVSGLENVITFGTETFRGCSSLSGILNLASATTLSQNCFYSCYCLRGIIFGKNISSLGSSCISNCYALYLLDFSEALQIPTLASSSSISSSNTALQIVVPDNLYDDWIVATNWTSHASKIIKKSDYDLQQGG